MATLAELAKQVPIEVGTLPPNIKINQDRYALRVINAEFGMSKSSGNPMITLELEIFHPASIVSVFNGKEYNVAGLKCKTYLTLADKTMQYTAATMSAIGIPDTYDLNPQNPETDIFLGKCFSAVIGADERTNRKDLTAQDKEAGRKVGEPILDENGQVTINYGIKLIGDIKPTKYTPSV